MVSEPRPDGKRKLSSDVSDIPIHDAVLSLDWYDSAPRVPLSLDNIFRLSQVPPVIVVRTECQNPFSLLR